MKKLLLILLMPLGIQAQIDISKTTAPHVVSKTAHVTIYGDAPFTVFYTDMGYPYIKKGFTISDRKSLSELLTLVASMDEKHDKTESYTVKTQTETLLLFWSRSQLIMSSTDNATGLSGSFPIDKRIANKLNDF